MVSLFTKSNQLLASLVDLQSNRIQIQEIVGGLMGDLENDEGKFHSSRAGFGLIVLNIHLVERKMEWAIFCADYSTSF